MATSISRLYCCLLILGILQAVKALNFKVYHGHVDNYVSIPIDDTHKIIENIDKSKDIVIFAFGFKGKESDESVQTIVSAYLTRGDVNILVFDWSAQSQVHLTELEYPVVILKARNVGADYGKALVKLIEHGVSPKRIHLIGHSLGAHVSGWGGQEVQKSHHNVSRITGLDPAGPLFSCGPGFDGLRSSQAQFVDVLHTSPGQMGTDESIGVVDFWANCGDSDQPSCKTKKKFKLPGKNQSCNHSYAWRLFAVAVNSPYAFQAAKASSCDKWKKQGTCTTINYLGDHVIRSLPGDFYFSTDADYPYGRKEAGLHPC